MMKFEQLVFHACFFPFVNAFIKHMIKAQFFVSTSLNNIKNRYEFLKRMHIIKPKLILILF